MREILFRGKRVDNGEWVYGWYAPLVCNDKTVISYIRDKNGTDKEVIPETVGQYTGLTDKNGKKIFEGDIVSYEDCPASDYYRETIIINRGVIEFSDGAFYATERETVDMDDLIYNGTMDCEVIGNIHDNPELLEKKNESV